MISHDAVVRIIVKYDGEYIILPLSDCCCYAQDIVLVPMYVE